MGLRHTGYVIELQNVVRVRDSRSLSILCLLRPRLYVASSALVGPWSDSMSSLLGLQWLCGMLGGDL